MFRRARHQKGSLQRVKRKSGPDVWEFRWYEIQTDGTKKYSKVVVGNVTEYKTETDAQTAADALRLEINVQTPRQQLQEISIETLVEHYRQHEMPDIFYKKKELPEAVAEDENRKSYATQDTYEGYLKKWILPRWKSYRLPDVKAVQVEQWLKSIPLAPGSKAKIRNIMSALYSHALRWEWVSRNPISSVRQSAKRRKIPVVLTIEQIRDFVANLKEPCRTAVLLGRSRPPNAPRRRSLSG
jgi:integrase